MPLSPADRTILRDLASRYAEIASLPVQQDRAAQWRDLNGRRPTRPLVRIFQIPWHEFAQEEELQLQCEDQGARGLENGYRMALYQWEHMRDDLVLEPIVRCGLAVSDTGFGIGEVSDVNNSSGLASRRFHEQIKDLADVERIKLPEVTHNEEATERSFAVLSELFEGIMPVRKQGTSHFWFAPWDSLITWYGVEPAMLDMALRPELVNACMTRLVDAWLHRLDQYEALNLLALGAAGEGAGSGGLSATDELPHYAEGPNGRGVCGHPAPGPDTLLPNGRSSVFGPSDRVTPMDLWGCATPQIFSEISPAMHQEFALQHELRWLERWGLNYYGCCEPLHTKIEILRQVPRLRKISCSPKCDKASMAEQCGRDYVISLKPNPAIFAGSYWDPEVARREIREDLEKLKGCVVEIILKDISTVSFQPQRLWLWAQIAREEAERFMSA
jgi:hypothetical protein